LVRRIVFGIIRIILCLTTSLKIVDILTYCQTEQPPVPTVKQLFST
jgi:hypothetical protein